MVTIKTNIELDYMREAGRIVALAHQAIAQCIQPGITSREIDMICEEVIRAHGATPSFKGLYGFPAATCISINSVLVHGIPSDIILNEGDIVSVDIGACYHGYHGDSAWTYGVGEITAEAQLLLDITKQSLFAGMKQAKAGNRLTDISHAIQEVVYGAGYSIPRDFSGHGVGRSVHEDPAVPNFGVAGKGLCLKSSMTLAIEPMVMMGRPQTITLHDGWTVMSKDGSLTAHYEHTIVVNADGYEILTTLNDKEEYPANG